MSACPRPAVLGRRIHGVIFFPRWVHEHPHRTVLHQNAHLPRMRRYRDAGPTSPIQVVSESATIAFIENCGVDNNEVIACPPAQIPAGYADRRA
ncbi:phenolic acid decarboxylase [Jiangella anatolica]|uniref:phenolic acid decarboxylase n=1 Tax=Jiangella anatolica TaxID=2670374 RepID=UPI0018F44EE1|nr:phenolic acid decarboxylase [Jiangella anatolica]